MICERCNVELEHYNPLTEERGKPHIVNHANIMVCPNCDLVYRVCGQIGEDFTDKIVEAFRIAANEAKMLPGGYDFCTGMGMVLGMLQETLKIDDLADRVRAEVDWTKGRN